MLLFQKYFSIFWRKYKFRSVVFENSVKLFVIFLICLMIPMILIYQYSMSDARNTLLKTNADSAKMFASTTEALIRDTEYLVAEMMADKDIEYYMSLGKDAVYTDSDKEYIVEKINTYMAGKNLINSIYVYNSSKNMLCTNKAYGGFEEFTDTSWIDEIYDNFSDNYKMISRKLDNSSKRVFTLIKKSRTNRSSVILNIDIYGMEKYMVKKNSDNDSFYIAEPEKILYTNLLKSKRDVNTENAIMQMIQQGNSNDIVKVGADNISISSERSPYYDWYYVSVSKNNNYTAIVGGLFYRMILIFFGLMIILIVISVSVSINNTLQFITILDLFENRDVYSKLSQNEISEVAEKIISLMDDNQKLKNEVMSRNMQYEEWKMKALQTQITPHFLNNTLAVINYEVIDKCENGESASAMIVKLSRILSYTMITDKILVTLNEELEFLKGYADLLRLRYDNFKIEIDADEKLLNCSILRMSLQPIIENSVFYGYKNKGGTIYIRCEDCGNDYNVIIEDKGSGIAEDKLESIKRDIRLDSMTGKNVGIKNIYKRMEAVYGERAKVDIISAEGSFTRVVLTIPKQI